MGSNNIKSLLTLLLVALTSVSAYADQAPPACPLIYLVSAVESMPKLSKPPVLKRDEREGFQAISLYESAGATDQFQYIALIDGKSQQAWVYQYGGFGGDYNWYGPLKIDTALAGKCPPAKGFATPAGVIHRGVDPQ